MYIIYRCDQICYSAQLGNGAIYSEYIYFTPLFASCNVLRCLAKSFRVGAIFHKSGIG
jgi:hypothetical protein